MPLICGLDLETTGLDPDKGHKIIEFGALLYTDKGDFVTKLVRRIDPLRSIDADAQMIHGISYSEVDGEPTFPDLAEEIRSFIDQAAVLVIHNAAFDTNFLAHEFVFAGVTPPNKPVYCTMENGRWATFEGKKPSLQELCFALGVEYDPVKAHAAEYDIERMMICYFEGIRRGFFNKP